MAEGQYHVNPETGRAGKCYAKKACKFGVPENQHFNSKDEAKAFIEQKEAKANAGNTFGTSKKAPAKAPAKKKEKWTAATLPRTFDEVQKLPVEDRREIWDEYERASKKAWDDYKVKEKKYYAMVNGNKRYKDYEFDYAHEDMTVAESDYEQIKDEKENLFSDAHDRVINPWTQRS